MTSFLSKSSVSSPSFSLWGYDPSYFLEKTEVIRRVHCLLQTSTMALWYLCSNKTHKQLRALSSTLQQTQIYLLAPHTTPRFLSNCICPPAYKATKSTQRFQHTFCDLLFPGSLHTKTPLESGLHSVPTLSTLSCYIQFSEAGGSSAPQSSFHDFSGLSM